MSGFGTYARATQPLWAVATTLTALLCACTAVEPHVSHVATSRAPAPVTAAPAAPLATSPTTRVAPAAANRFAAMAAPGPPWQIAPGHAGGIAGYAAPIDVAPGQPVTLYVSTPAARFVVRAFRMGWFDGRLGQEEWHSGAVVGHRQPPPVFDPGAPNTETTHWRPSITIDTTGWTPGDYLLRLDASSGGESFVPLTVRGPTAAGTVVIISPVTTWQAYNSYGCCDLYVGGDGSFGARSRAVSFDRPYLMENGAGEFIRDELGVVAEAQRLHLALDYVTDVDLQTIPQLLAGARAVVSVGHDEYWSRRMRAAVTKARNAGTNLAFLGANAIYRRIRFGTTALGRDRLEINYKVASEDPMYGHDNAVVTTDWPSPPAADPESSLLGDQYACMPANPAEPGVIADPHSWLFAGVATRTGERLPGLIGVETDAVQPGYPTPRPIDVVMHSPTDCPGGGPPFADASYYVAPSGAGVFDAGTVRWAFAVAPDYGPPVTALTHEVVRTVTDNLLKAFAVGPAGATHPAHDDLAALGIG